MLAIKLIFLQPPKSSRSADHSLKFESVRVESLVIADQHAAVNQF